VFVKTVNLHTNRTEAERGQKIRSVLSPLSITSTCCIKKSVPSPQSFVSSSTYIHQMADQDIAIEASLKTTGLGSALAKDDGVVPLIDLSSGDSDHIAQQLFQAATQVGFFSITGHGIPQTLIDQAFNESQTFFEQPLEVKRQQSPCDMSINCGFEHYAQVRPSTGVADQKESLQVTAREGAMDARWPSPHFESAAKQLLEASHALANRLLELLQPLAVPQVQPGTLSKSHTLWSPEGQCTLRFLHYPAQDPETTSKLLQEGYWRAGPHTGEKYPILYKSRWANSFLTLALHYCAFTDWDNLTLLYQRPGQAGLECCANPRTGDPKEMYWTKVNPVEGAIAVNIGDMLARWSDGRLFSNLHRVRLPPDATKPRYSIAYFAQSDKTTLIETENNPAITAGDYILSRIQSNFEEAKKIKT
jgi:isopenicillin N synthase-like dioxygenase